MRKKHLIILLSLIPAIVFVSCDLLQKQYSYIFKNDSSHTVEVSPEGQTSWQTLSIEAGAEKSINPGSDYISFWFPSGGPQYRTAELVSILSEQQMVFTFYDSTTVIAKSLLLNTQDIDAAVPLPGTGNMERAAEWERALVN
jgi:hypothetical protein